MKKEYEPFLWSLNFLDVEQLKAIGAVAVESAFLELSLETDIHIACEVDSRIGELIASGLMLDKKVDLLRQALTPLLKDDPSLRKQFADVFVDLKAVIVDRNTVIHGAWLSDKVVLSNDDDGTLRITTTGEKKAIRFPRGASRPQVVKANDVLVLARKIAECRDRLARALAQCTDWETLRRRRDERESRRGPPDTTS